MAVSTVPKLRRALQRRPPGLREEQQHWDAGHEVVVGVDEVGRGAWAGPISVGAAVVPRHRRIYKVRDSKLLTEDEREALFSRIAGWCDAWAVGHASHEECDAYTEVLRFKEQLAERGVLYWEFATTAEFADQLRSHLSQAVRAARPGRGREGPAPVRPAVEAAFDEIVRLIGGEDPVVRSDAVARLPDVVADATDGELRRLLPRLIALARRDLVRDDRRCVVAATGATLGRLCAPGLPDADRARKVDLVDTWLPRIKLRGLDLTGADLAFAHLAGARLRGAKLDRAKGLRVDLGGAELSQASLEEARFNEAMLDGAKMHNCYLVSARFARAGLTEVELFGSKAQGADFRGADLRGSRFNRVDVNDADFRGAHLDDVALASLADADHWDNAKLDHEHLDRLRELAANGGEGP